MDIGAHSTIGLFVVIFPSILIKQDWMCTCGIPIIGKTYGKRFFYLFPYLKLEIPITAWTKYDVYRDYTLFRNFKKKVVSR